MFPNPDETQIEQGYQHARAAYAQYGVDTGAACEALARLQVSLHCWQGDDVAGFEQVDATDKGGIQATGNYPGRARTADELRADLECAFALIPGKHRLNLHAIYAETGGTMVSRDALGPEHFANWIDWAKTHAAGLDFNPTCFGHPMAQSGFTLASNDPHVRNFWIDHCRACRKIGAHMGRELGTPCVTNVWIPDGYKDTPADRRGPRETLQESLDAVFSERIDRAHLLDAVESKLFGIGSESYVVGSHEFYLGYAIRNGVLLCLDAGHFHPTEVISDKISSVLAFLPAILLHVSRGVRWDSDHVVILSGELRAIAQEIVRNEYTARVHIGLDFFDASINRVAAWVIGTRAMLQALLLALLEPAQTLIDLELQGDYTARLALSEQLKALPFGAVWDHYCLSHSVPPGLAWMNEVKRYEDTVLSRRL